MTYFLATRPETVVSIVNRGKLPEKLPSYCQQALTLSPTVSQSLPTPCRIDQTFVLMVEGSTLEPNAISYLIVASEKAHRLVVRLFKNHCPKPIQIAPKFFSEKKKRDIPEPASPAKRVKLTQENTNSLSQRSPSPPIAITRIVDEKQHIDWLTRAIQTAKRSVLITSYAIKGCSLKATNFYDLVEAARKRGVKFYVYDGPGTDGTVGGPIAFFLYTAQRYETICNHSKIVVVDRRMVAISSFNWLSDVDEEWDPSFNASFVYSGPGCCQLIDRIWVHVKQYVNEKYDNFSAQKRYYKKNEHLQVWKHQVTKDTMLSYLPSLDTHREYFQNLFARAKQRIIICSPFVSGHFEDDTDLQDIRDAMKRNVQLIFAVLPSSRWLRVKKVFPRARLVEIERLHQKTVIVDDDEIAEGSFNWFSAVRDSDDIAHNMEATFVLKGSGAVPFIKKFFSDPVGKQISKALD